MERVRTALAGEPIDADELGYELDSWHLAAIASGPQARSTLRALATTLDRRLLIVPAAAGTIWAWLGGRGKIASREVLRLAEACWPEAGALVLGEPGEGIGGWRLTHRQAQAAVPVAMRGTSRIVRYADVALLASALGDEVLAGSLRSVYLAPLKGERDGGMVLRQTLLAYFGAGRNASSAAAALGVHRKTVGLRLQAVEERIGRPIDDCAAELETAMGLWELGRRRGENPPRRGGNNCGRDATCWLWRGAGGGGKVSQ